MFDVIVFNRGNPQWIAFTASERQPETPHYAGCPFSDEGLSYYGIVIIDGFMCSSL